MPHSFFADRIGDLIGLTDAETKALAAMEQRERAYKRGGVVFRENDRTADLFVLKRGLLMSYFLLNDGTRQILRLVFPGDLFGMAALAYRKSPDNVSALADSVVCPIDRTAVAGLISHHPRLAAVMMAMAQIERVVATDRLAGLGRISAKARVAALLLEIRNSLRITDRSIGATFSPRLTQEEIGDATGLTAVHVNRMLRQLEEDGTIERTGGKVTLLDEPALEREANYLDRSNGLDLGWIPPSRP